MADVVVRFNLFVVILPLITALMLGLAPLLAPLRRRVSSDRFNHWRLQLVIFVASWILSWIAFTGVVAKTYYQLASYFFDSTFGQMPGVTHAAVESQAGPLLVEIWLHTLFGWLAPTLCFTRSEVVCQLARYATNPGPVEIGSGLLGALAVGPAVMAILPAWVSVLIARMVGTRPRYTFESTA